MTKKNSHHCLKSTETVNKFSTHSFKGVLGFGWVVVSQFLSWLSTSHDELAHSEQKNKTNDLRI